MINRLAILSLLFLSLIVLSQKKISISDQTKISIITSGSGDNLYEKFGHTSIRIKDHTQDLDENYNYGIFDTSGENFYVNFTKGYMKYKLVRYPFYYTLQSASKEKRWVKEQILNLTNTQKKEFLILLEENLKSKNSSYLYDPFFNNCATKPRDLIQKVLGDKLILSEENLAHQKSLRELMNEKIHINTWGSFGINLALGSVLDKKISNEEYLYLPDYLYSTLEKSKIITEKEEKKLISESSTLIKFADKTTKISLFSPLNIMVVMFLIIIITTIKDLKNKKDSKWIDYTLFTLTGCIGFLLIFLWFFTNHSTAPNNFNILWGFAPNLLIPFFLNKKKKSKWIKPYLILLIVMLLFIPIIWITKTQLFSYPLIPFLIGLLVRYLYLQKTLNS